MTKLVRLFNGAAAPVNHRYEPRQPPASSKTPGETSIDRSTGTHQSSSAPHHLHRKRLQNRRFYYRRASIARTRSHPPPLITNTEKKASLKPSPTPESVNRPPTRAPPSKPIRNRKTKNKKP
ncbi:hypothetical protein Bca4012_049033 [Brassica carinata]